ncbi:CAAX prenyl protease 1 [Podila verticillata]|nr:CAAX prenyl protease 1 [Podila verticillata]
MPVAFQLLMTTVYPTLITSLFNKFAPLPEGELHSITEALSSRVQFPLQKLFVVDAASASIPKLPTECLLRIVDKVGDNITTSRALLTVNSSFFHASLPHLVEVWMRKVDHQIIKPDFAS